MVKKIDELIQPVKDVNSPESQEFLRNLIERLQERRKSSEEMLRQWQEEDLQDIHNQL